MHKTLLSIETTDALIKLPLSASSYCYAFQILYDLVFVPVSAATFVQDILFYAIDILFMDIHFRNSWAT